MNKRKQILEGSRVIALTIKNIKPDVVSAYPITPQTHIVENLAQYKANTKTKCEYVRAESEFAAASIILGASATGVRVYSATSSQGLLLMTEVLFNISGMRLPIVITCANRAVSAPINIWNDHSDAMALRDAGWIQFFIEDHQEAVYYHILAYKIAEQLQLPVLVNVDGFILTHSYEPVYIPPRKLIKKYLPDYKPKAETYLDPNNPVTLGGFYSPETYMDTRRNLHHDLLQSIKMIKKEYKILKKVFSISSPGNGLIEYTGDKKAETVLVAMGSMIGTIKETIKNNPHVAVLKINLYRPFPKEEIKKALQYTKNVAVIEKAISPGQNGPLFNDIEGIINKKINISNYIIGLGGQDVTAKKIKKIIKYSIKKHKESIFI